MARGAIASVVRGSQGVADRSNGARWRGARPRLRGTATGLVAVLAFERRVTAGVSCGGPGRRADTARPGGAHEFTAEESGRRGAGDVAVSAAEEEAGVVELPARREDGVVFRPRRWAREASPCAAIAETAPRGIRAREPVDGARPGRKSGGTGDEVTTRRSADGAHAGRAARRFSSARSPAAAAATAAGRGASCRPARAPPAFPDACCPTRSRSAGRPARTRVARGGPRGATGGPTAHTGQAG